MRMGERGVGDAIVLAMGIVVMEGENSSEMGKQWHKAQEAHGREARSGGHGDDATTIHHTMSIET